MATTNSRYGNLEYRAPRKIPGDLSKCVVYHPDRVRDRRIEMHKTQDECANCVGMSKPTYRLCEKGDRCFELKDLIKLASFLSVEILYFFYSSWPIEIVPYRSWTQTPKS